MNKQHYEIYERYQLQSRQCLLSISRHHWAMAMHVQCRGIISSDGGRSRVAADSCLIGMEGRVELLLLSFLEQEIPPLFGSHRMYWRDWESRCGEKLLLESVGQVACLIAAVNDFQ